MKIASNIVLTSAIILMAFSCDKPVTPALIEELTSMTYTLVPLDGGDTVVLNASDPGGFGGSPPNIVVDTFLINKAYDGFINVIDESITPTKEVTYVIEHAKEDYQFFYSSNSPTLNVDYDDADLRGDPIGLKTTLFSGDTQGNLRITLRLRPDKGGEGVSEGNIENAGGVTEIDFFFPIFLK